MKVDLRKKHGKGQLPGFETREDALIPGRE
jgi:hypothetical protein